MTILEKTGAQAFDKWEYKILLLVSSIVAAFVISKMGMLPGMLILGLPVVIFVLNILIKKPLSAVWGSIFIGFFTAGLARYVSAPFGLLMDIILIAAWIGLIFKNKQTNIPWKNLKDSGYIVSGIWFLMVLLELGNPEMVSGMAWFYAMRAVGFYQMLVLGLVYLFVNDKSFLDKFLKVISWLSVAGTIWGLKQMIIGTDAAEEYWLFVEGYADTHVLAGVLRVFSFYSDAGQFGASQAQLALMAGIIAIGPGKWSTRLFYVFIAVITFVGFGISGTRGALAVPAGGAIAYLVVSRNFKLLIAGILAMGISFYFLKYTYALQGVEQVRRMRTALNVDDPSLQVRLQNQIKFGNYLASRPFGGGIGSAGYWGYRFSPHTFLANTATDSYYVKIWAETGIIGISLHLAMFGFFLGKGGVIIWHLRDPILRQKIIALYSGVVGILLSSYGNQVFSQMPTGIIMYISIPLIFISPKFDNPPPKNED